MLIVKKIGNYRIGSSCSSTYKCIHVCRTLYPLIFKDLNCCNYKTTENSMIAKQ